MKYHCHCHQYKNTLTFTAWSSLHQTLLRIRAVFWLLIVRVWSWLVHFSMSAQVPYYGPFSNEPCQTVTEWIEITYEEASLHIFTKLLLSQEIQLHFFFDFFLPQKNWKKLLGLRKFSNLNVLHKGLLIQDWVFRLGTYLYLLRFWSTVLHKSGHAILGIGLLLHLRLPRIASWARPWASKVSLD